jgi:hypothetical protein
MTPQTYLNLLTIVGLAVGSISGLISLLTKTSVEVDGTMRKRLTSPGRWALAISLLGFAGSFSSEMLKSSIQARAQAQAQLNEIFAQQKEKENKEWQGRSETLQAAIKIDTKAAVDLAGKSINQTIEGFKKEEVAIADSRERVLRDNLLHEVSLYGKLSAAGTPLTSLSITFTVDDVPKAVRDKLRKEIADAPNTKDEDWVTDLFEHHNIDDDDADAFVQARIYEEAVQPFIDYLATGRLRREHALLVLSLDRRYSALACLGWISEADQRWTETITNSSKESQSTLLPSGIFVGSEIDSHHTGVHGDNGTLLRQRTARPSFNIGVKGNSVFITLDLTLQSLGDALLRYPANSPATAGLSDDVEFFTWSPTSDGEMSKEEVDDSGLPELPFDIQRVRHSLTDVDVYKDRRSTPDWVSSDSGDREKWANGNATWVRNAPAWMHRIHVRIVPNGVEQVAKTYVLSLSSAGYPIEGTREDEPRGYVQIWHGHAR